MKSSFPKDSYLTVNLLFTAIIVFIIGYSYSFSANGIHHPIPSGVSQNERETSISSGLSRSFSEIVRFRFREAATYNPHGIRIFSFFLMQLLMRVVISLLLVSGMIAKRKWLVATDVMVSVSLFGWAFWPFMISTVHQFNAAVAVGFGKP